MASLPTSSRPGSRWNRASIAETTQQIESAGSTPHNTSARVRGIDTDQAYTPRRARALRYLLVLLLLPLFAIPLLIALGRSDFFLSHGASVWVQSNDAVFNMHNRHCDVVVFGDSTAMTGINPEVVRRSTGLETCNIAVTNAVLAVTDNLALDSFLHHNSKPRVLLVQLSPDLFEQENHAWRRTIYAEGLLELLRHGPPDQARRTLLQHPQEALAFAGYAAGFTAFYAGKNLLYRLTGIRPAEDAITVRNGFFTPPSAPRSSCHRVGVEPDPNQRDFSRQLAESYRTRYAGQAGTVLVNVAPIPTCDANLESFQAQLRGITNNALLPLPIGVFNDDRHYTAVGSTIVSRLVAQQITEQIKNIEVENTTAATRTPLPAQPPVRVHRVALHR